MEPEADLAFYVQGSLGNMDFSFSGYKMPEGNGHGLHSASVSSSAKQE